MLRAFICVTCGTQYPPSEQPPDRCEICLDERQFVNPRGQTWTSANIKLLWWVGLLCIFTPLLWPVTYTLQGLALAIDLPAGERSFSFSIGVSSQAVYEIMKGILLCAFSLLMRDAKTISDEHNCYV